MRTMILCVATVLAQVACGRGRDEANAVGSGSQVAPAKATAGDERFPADALGALTFSLTEGTPVARAHFSRGLLALHSFWYDEAARQFQAAVRADPTMNLAHWGIAMSHLQLLWGEDDLSEAKIELARMPDPDRLSPREQAWVVATLELIRAPDVRSGRRAYVTAMEQLHREFPDDESATFLAVALLSTIRPGDPDNLAIRERAAALAGEVYQRNPRHPGAAHYMIHAFDTPELASKALGVANAYRQIAPAAFHALHMPAHIYLRLGMWADAIASCRDAWEASVAAARREKLSINAHDFHSLSWLVEMPFELGRQKDADAALATFGQAVAQGLSRRHRAVYASEVGSYLMRTQTWTRVDELLAPLTAAPLEDKSSSNACGAPSLAPADLGEQLAILETRALAAAMQHDVAKTTQLVAEHDKVRARLTASLTGQTFAMVAEINASVARTHRALLARATNDDRALIAALREMTEAAHAESGGETNPSAFVASEELGDALLRAGKADLAGEAYARALVEHPGRARSLLGAARAAIARKDAVAAARYYQDLRTLWRDAEPTTAGLDEVRAALPPK